jgi:uncharacterized protein YjbJ (UPF0337 family)
VKARGFLLPARSRSRARLCARWNIGRVFHVREPRIELGDQLIDEVPLKEASMNWDRISGNWKQFGGKLKEKWGQLTDDDLTAINGRRDQLEGKLQERYGWAKDQVRKDVDDWLDTM